jgi:hypothetical protein
LLIEEKYNSLESITIEAGLENLAKISGGRLHKVETPRQAIAKACQAVTKCLKFKNSRRAVPIKVRTRALHQVMKLSEPDTSLIQ